ncbi:hypothetical protein NDU88_010122 [Pleurodeles waltl]|uniref:Uncharacterized protein n=1 Tax=Pleurodeles waltl TaxID=8319 RepID=A0AAV7PV16_PLEWA|nr:hypothetical protein NDU88_010122 [Pleurodeles waltl]
MSAAQLVKGKANRGEEGGRARGARRHAGASQATRRPEEPAGSLAYVSCCLLCDLRNGFNDGLACVLAVRAKPNPAELRFSSPYEFGVLPSSRIQG